MRQEIHVTDSGGRSVILSFVLNAFVGALTLRFIVGRTKLCLDFTCTYHMVHLFICWFYNGAFPSTFSWWFLNAVCATVMCVCSEFLCLQIELKEIPVGYTPLDTKADLWNHSNMFHSDLITTDDASETATATPQTVITPDSDTINHMEHSES